MPATDDDRTPDQVDAEFARIVAGFNLNLPAETTTEEKPTEEKPTGPIWPASGPILNSDPRAVGPNDPSLLDALDTFGSGLPDDSPETFVPPPPPPLPKVPFSVIAAVFSIILGFVMFLDSSLLPINGRLTSFLGLVCILGGAATLIMRLRPGGPDEEPPADDGAVV